MAKEWVTVCAMDTAGLADMALQGRRIADRNGLSLRIVLFQQKTYSLIETAHRLEYAYRCAVRADACMEVFYVSDDSQIKKQMQRDTRWLIWDKRESQGLCLKQYCIDQTDHGCSSVMMLEQPRRKAI